ncbi:MAG: DegV family protein [Clostridia bacterium]|nr:DegV family protein [Clostridia bacterium]
MSVRIIVDSTVDISDRYKDHMRIVPLTVRFGDEEYKDRVELGALEFYEKLVSSDLTPSTSQANISDFQSVLEEETKTADEIIIITLSSKLSGTFNSAMIAAEDYGDKVFVVDSLSVSIGAGILAEFAVELARAGLNARGIVKRLKVERENIKLLAVFDTLEYLKRGGRISATAAFAGSMLSLKPIVTVRDGEIAVLGKARGSKHANGYLTSEIERSVGINFNKPLLFGYTGFDDSRIRSYIEESRHLYEGHLNEPDIAIVGSVVGTHAGPGAIAIAFFMR